ncbi:MAG: ATP-binding protein [Phenylobacterium sp.]|uniref:ATP-binding protein n=1 Tax=Phenylobacterium sp. TaxID=1871053 RepID=UPI001A3EAD06|nr:ATP-binding protein [Phenylobacterium sp.]MBL8555831.1 ATP-binding protein [Phenylobacterium sp.]
MNDTATVAAAVATPADGALARLAEALRVASARRGPAAAELVQGLGGQVAALARDPAVLAGRAGRPAISARAVLDAIAAAHPASAHRISVDCAPEHRFSLDELPAIGMIVCEAIANALRHAFPAGREGHVWIRLAEDGPRWRLTVRDDGQGIADLPGTPPGGAGLVEALAETLEGYARLGSAPFGGGLVSAIFPRTA